MHAFDSSMICTAARRLQGHVVRTPLLHSPVLDALASCRVFVKAESLQRTGAFKYRGALNKILSLPAEQVRAGFVTYSAGNHGQAVAAAAHAVGCPATIVLPRNAARIKVESCRWWGAETVFYDPQVQAREEVARRIAEPRGMTIVPPFDDLDIMAGQGTAGLEICDQLAEANAQPDAVLLNCSGGGLASGVAQALRDSHTQIAVHVVEPQGYDKMARSLAAGSPQKNHEVPRTLMDGIAGPSAGSLPLQVLMRHGATGLSVSDDEVLHAMAAAFRTLKLVLEPAGAASLAAVLAQKTALQGKTVVLVASGGNVDPEVFRQALDRA
ncbi:MAG: pyridoxal-5'-phosphate-dependent protein [Variovorax paradoxus]|nr:MAG: pyridoxal-5'-phosphate-dependent protein [Variovorax paradoxus]PZQ12227.1 MAG: pyridoxal-5'-phosphate-dependent protein [Variovorax paradoxus]